MRHHREGDHGQHGLQQQNVVVGETLGLVGGKGIADASSARRVAVGTKAEDLCEVIGGAGGGMTLEVRKIKLGQRPGEPPPQVQPRLGFAAGGLQLTN